MDHSLLIAGEGIGGLWGGRSEEMWEGGQRMGGGGRNVTKILQTPPPTPSPHAIKNGRSSK